MREVNDIFCQYHKILIDYITFLYTIGSILPSHYYPCSPFLLVEKKIWFIDQSSFILHTVIHTEKRKRSRLFATYASARGISSGISNVTKYQQLRDNALCINSRVRTWSEIRHDTANTQRNVMTN